MSPFAHFLRVLRQRRGLKQKDIALLLGYEPSYLSALERSEKGPPKEDFIRRLIKGLDLDETEQANLHMALKLSRRQVSLPAQASEEEYGLIHELEPQLGQLTPLQIHLIKLALRLPASLSVPTELFGLASSPSERKEAPKM
ncbi:MAG TPA: helix-turn-helix transcriptional regulator [Rhodocyclaceae bacterium]